VTARGYRQQNNRATAWIDLSQVYSTSDVTLRRLRTFQNGQLNVSQSALGTSLLPFRGAQFDAGDPRAMENLPLLALHMLFHLEHNRLAKELQVLHKDWDDESLFQEARRFLIGIHQHMVFYEFLPKLLGHHLPDYSGFQTDYSPGVDPGFIAALSTFSHNSMPPGLLIVHENRQPSGPGFISVTDTDAIAHEFLNYGLDRVVRGLMTQPQALVDLNVISELRDDRARGIDHAAADIQRARDHGVPSYNDVRRALHLPPIANFTELSADPGVQRLFEELYGSVDDLDLVPAALAEPLPYDRYMLPMTLNLLLTEQFERLRNGDPLFYEREGVFTESEIADWIKPRTLPAMILTHTTVQSMPPDAFILQTTMDYSVWDRVPPSSWRSFTPLPGLALRWTISVDIWMAELLSSKGGWVGVGFGTNMTKSDVILSYLGDDGAPIVKDCHVFSDKDYVVAPVDDVFFGGRNDILPGATVQLRDGLLIARFARKLNTTDFADVVIENRPMDMIFAHGVAQLPGQHGYGNRVATTLNLFADHDESHTMGEGQRTALQAASISLIAVQCEWNGAAYADADVPSGDAAVHRGEEEGT
jgi:hypothetical protein